ncbi:MAG TPA: hypothetical protein VKB31_06110, partial [Trueperaceae bacterium]|nr:hypothetical protein [Trueperaceae bacterium]
VSFTMTVGGRDFYDGDNNSTPGTNIGHGAHVAGLGDLSAGTVAVAGEEHAGSAYGPPVMPSARGPR